MFFWCFLLDDTESRKAETLLEIMEQIDDDCAKRGIHFVKVSEDGAAEKNGVARLPSLVFFKNDLPSLYEGIKSLFPATNAPIHGRRVKFKGGGAG
jgi:hypothetical protein